MNYLAFRGNFFDKGTFWVTVAVLIFLALYGRKLVGFITAMLDQRANEIRRALDEAAALRREAEAMLREAEAKRAEASLQARAMIENAAREAERMAARLMQEAEDSAKRRERMAMDRITAAESDAVSGVRHAAASLAARAAEIVLRETVDAERDAALIDHAIAGIPAALSRRAA
jgi:F-type H+-transporting ATPase subunit b